MRLALLSDIHGNLAALEAVTTDLRRRGVDRVVNLGDSVSGPLLPRETAAFLMAEGWLSLAGNHERQLLAPAPRNASDTYAHAQLTEAQFDWLRASPPTAQLTPEVFLCHGTPASDLVPFLETVANDGHVRPATLSEVDSRLGSERSSLVACGHTHVPRARCSTSGQQVVNPGSVGLQAYDDDHPVPHHVETGAPDARYAIVESTSRGWVVDLISVPYDSRSMARLARERGRPDWEHALLTGACLK
jgi:predicted phosphodiesterase